jgi:uncharacterized protein YjbI with pentapeptide repeats
VVARFRSWWRKVKQHPRIATAVVVVLFAGIVFIFAVYKFGWDWTGFTSTNGPVLKPNEQYRPAKTLWDVLQLLIVPIILAIGGFWLNQIQKRREEKTAQQRVKAERKAAEQRAQVERLAAEKRAQTERDIALDNQREVALQAYIDKISELLTEEQLLRSQPEDEVRTIARVRTLSVLPRLDGERKRYLLLFLFEAGLIDKGHQIINVNDADFSEANLSKIHLHRTQWFRENSRGMKGTRIIEADLTGVNLRNANLNGADLSHVKLGAEFEVDLELSIVNGIITDLSEAQLVKADLWLAVLGGADLSRANLSEAILSGAYLQSANLYKANLQRVDLGIQTLLERDPPGDDVTDISGWRGANLSEANLRGANLREASLWQAELKGADLREADLTRADLDGADLSGAKLEGAVGITPEQLAKARSLKGATMPDGSEHP